MKLFQWWYFILELTESICILQQQPQTLTTSVFTQCPSHENLEVLNTEEQPPVEEPLPEPERTAVEETPGSGDQEKDPSTAWLNQIHLCGTMHSNIPIKTINYYKENAVLCSYIYWLSRW